MTSSTNVTTEYGKQNIFAKEVPPQLIENYSGYSEDAERTNGRWAMIGITALLGSYAITGQVLPGVF